MTVIDQSGLAGKTRDRPISKELEIVLAKAGAAAGIDTIHVTSGGQPGTRGRSTGSTRHNGGRAADLHLEVAGKTLTFSNATAPAAIKRFITAAAAQGAIGIGAGIGYMGDRTIHVGFGQNIHDTRRIVWGAGGRSANAPPWLQEAARSGWTNPPDWARDIDIDQPEDLSEEEDDEFDEGDDADDRAIVVPDIPERFTLEVIRAAQATQERWGTPASITLAQWAIESGYGKHMPPGSNNPFGIKAVGDQPKAWAMTTEYIGGRAVRKKEPFRVFASLEEAFIKHGELLGTSGHYVKARKFSHDPDRFADALTGIYATDPNYGSLLKQIMRRNDLYRYDISGAIQDDHDDRAGGPRPLRKGDVDLFRVKALQQRLVQLNYNLGKIDGKFGTLTAAALFAFQSDNDLPASGMLDAATEAALAQAQPRALDPERQNADEKYLVKKGSKVALNARRNRIMSWIAGIFGAVGITNSAVQNAQPTAASVLDGIAAGSTLTAEQLQQLRNLKLDPTILDTLAALFPAGSNLHQLSEIIATVASSILPGFGGSVGVLALGLLGRYFSNRISGARVDAHRAAEEIGPLNDADD